MITNVVCTATLNCEINLRTLTNANRNIIYDPANYSGARWKHPKIGGHCSVFSTGKLIVNGKVDSVAEAKRRLRRYARHIQRQGWRVTLSDLKVITMSASFKTAGPLDLMKVARYYGGQYEPDVFPAAMFTKDAVHFTCFHTGSVLMTGLKRTRDVYDICMPILIEMPLLI